jgi:pSer/pThr/pTyr-binding forkhead associated (FHA) protein
MTVRLANSVTSEVIVVDRFPSLVGRAPEANIPLDDAKIGNYQCMIDRTHLGLVIWDLGTVCGTRVNGVPVTKAILNPNDEITIGRFSFRLLFEPTRRAATRML